MADTKHTGPITPENPFHVGEPFNSLQEDQKPTGQKEIDPLWPFPDPPKSIERDLSTEKNTWKEHIEPIVKKHDLRKLSGEHFEYHFFEKLTDEKGVHAMVSYTMWLCRDIQFSKAGVPADETDDPFGGADNFSENVVRQLRDSEKWELKKFFKKKKDGGEIDLRDTIRDLLENVFRDNTLPEFLEMLRRDLGLPCRERDSKGLENKDAIEQTNIMQHQRNIDELIDKDPTNRNDTKQHQNNSFILNGDNWFVNYNGDETTLRDLERIRYIIHLLDNPNIEFPSHRLVSLVKKNEFMTTQNYDVLNEKRLKNEGLTQNEHLVEGFTKEEYEKLKIAACELWDRSIASENDQKAQQEWEDHKKIFLNQYGIAINDRGEKLKFILKNRLNKDAERARVNVKKRIDAAIKDIKKNLPSLAEYLKRNISTGKICTYKTDPDNPINWDIRWQN